MAASLLGPVAEDFSMMKQFKSCKLTYTPHHLPDALGKFLLHTQHCLHQHHTELWDKLWQAEDLLSEKTSVPKDSSDVPASFVLVLPKDLCPKPWLVPIAWSRCHFLGAACGTLSFILPKTWPCWFGCSQVGSRASHSFIYLSGASSSQVYYLPSNNQVQQYQFPAWLASPS